MRGQALSLAGDTDGAIAEYREALRIDPDFVLAHANLGHALRTKGRLDEAIEQFQDAVAIEAGYVPAHYALGLALIQKGQLETAIAHLHIARQLAPDDASVRIALSAGLLKWGDVNGAITQAREAVQLSSDSAPAHFALGLAMSTQGSLADAVTEFEAAAKIDDKNPIIENNLGLARAGKGDIDGAVEAYKAAVALAPNSADIHNNLGAALLDNDKPDEASVEFAKAVSLDPANPMYQRNYATALGKKGDADRAIASYHDSLRIDPKDVSLHEGIGLTLLGRADLDAAIEQFVAGMSADPSNADVEKALAAIVGHFVWCEHLKLLDTMRPEAYTLPPRIAVNHDPLRELEAQARQMIPALRLRGCQKGGRAALIELLKNVSAVEPVVMSYTGHMDKRLEIISGDVKVIRPTSLPDYILKPLALANKLTPNAPEDLTPDMRKCVCGIAIALQHWDDLTEAIAELRIAAQAKPDWGAAHNNLGRALLLAGRVKEALSEFDAALRLSPDLGEARFNSGVALGLLGMMPQATVEWKRALAITGDRNAAPTDNYLGIAALENTEFALARSYFEAAVRADATFAPAAYNLGMITALEASSLPLAETAKVKSRDIAPFGTKHYELRGEFLLNDKLMPAADAILAADQLDGDLKSIYQYVGVEFCLQPADAATNVEGVAIVHDTNAGVGLHPDCTSVHNNVGVLMAAKGDLAGGQKMLEAAVAEMPGYALDHWNLGQILIRAGKKEEGQREVNLAARLGQGQNLPYILPFKMMSSVAAAVPAEPVPQPAAQERPRRYHARNQGQGGDVQLREAAETPAPQCTGLLDAFHAAYTH
jgi:tetratricopeptide (TPR) repeat protein